LTKTRYDKENVISRYGAWFSGKDSERCFDTGATFHTVFSQMRKGESNQEAVQSLYKKQPENVGVNAAHRSVPISMAGFISDHNMLSAVAEEARITHFHPLSAQVAQAVNTICRSLIKGEKWEAALILAKSLPGLDRIVVKALNGEKPELGGYAPAVLQSAVHFMASHQHAPEQALTSSLKFAGSANFCPVLVGAFVGAQIGKSGVSLRAGHELRDCSVAMMIRMDSVATVLAATWDSTQSQSSEKSYNS